MSRWCWWQPILKPDEVDDGYDDDDDDDDDDDTVNDCDLILDMSDIRI